MKMGGGIKMQICGPDMDVTSITLQHWGRIQRTYTRSNKSKFQHD